MLAIDGDVVLVAVEALVILLGPSFCAFLASSSSRPSGVLPALIASFSSRVLCCLAALTMTEMALCVLTYLNIVGVDKMIEAITS
jgi:hypothetical protein